jgi:hypothetical protein
MGVFVGVGVLVGVTVGVRVFEGVGVTVGVRVGAAGVEVGRLSGSTIAITPAELICIVRDLPLD